jgi:predicted O-methyltransferase YrrM
MDIKLDQIKSEINKKLDQARISGKILLDRLRVIDETSRKTAAYADPRYTPFYYYLGHSVPAQTLLEIGFNLGLLTTCFLKGCSTVESVLGFQERQEGFYSPRLGRANVKSVYKKEFDLYVGDIIDDAFLEKISPKQWDVVIFNDETGHDKHLQYLDFVWPYIASNGIVVMDYIVRHTPAKQAFEAFCKAKNRVPVTFETRYGTGIIQK